MRRQELDVDQEEEKSHTTEETRDLNKKYQLTHSSGLHPMCDEFEFPAPTEEFIAAQYETMGPSVSLNWSI